MRKRLWPMMVGLLMLKGWIFSCGRGGATEEALRAPSGTPRSTVALEIDPDSLPKPFREIDGIRREVLKDGRVFITGQPSESALRALARRGVQAVVNLRTPAEMNNRRAVPFDEAGVVEALGMEYVPIPLGGRDYPYSPEAVDRLEDVLRRHSGDVLLHCAVAGRAMHLWVAYLIRYQGYDVDAALQRGRALGVRRRDLAGLFPAAPHRGGEGD
ncbi:MAG: sulfur transferase domain-containing protein [Acidobacteriota bacterium]|nr:sulfur transferase domain-containing protein [Acidobacteriota bacterium]MDQ7086957.1 sulfur transferase domain-containing protein [Acidobacteriota bacterium]